MAFLLRVTAVLLWSSHFFSYYGLADVLVHGGGYCMRLDGTMCACFPPV
jgi:hypothetical protein